MNENIDLTKILKDCPKGFKLYSLLHGEVSFREIDESNDYPIRYDYTITSDIGNYTSAFSITRNGTYSNDYNGGCIIFPSKDQRDWNKFTAPWYKKERFDPKTLKPFDRVIVRNHNGEWECAFFSHIKDYGSGYQYDCCYMIYRYCIPYNEETKYLVGTTEEAPEYYRYWED